jgi:uncharacterized BrkB/YihY/UPF0761 family membrane protein
MDRAARERREVLQNRGLDALDGAMSLILILLIIQIWLVSATLNSYLAGFNEAVVPGAIISGLLFLGCAALYRFVNDVEKRSAVTAGKD